MNETASKDKMVKAAALAGSELEDTRIESITGGEFDKQSDQYFCDRCGCVMDFVGINHQCVLFFHCPNCGMTATSLGN